MDEIEEIKLNNYPKDEIIKWFIEFQTISDVLERCRENNIKVTLKTIEKILDKNGVKKKCVICNGDIKASSRTIFCSEKCRKERFKDNIRSQQHNRRAKGSGKTAYSVSRREKIKESYGICYLCNEQLDTSVKDVYHPLYIVLDHVNPLTYSNDSRAENIKPTCRCCNNLKLDKPADYYTTEEYRENKFLKVENYIPKAIMSKDNEQAFINDCNQGMTFEQLCKKYNRSAYIIYKRKKRLGLIKENKLHNKLNPHFLHKKVVQLVQEEKTGKEISSILGISLSTVNKYRKIAVEEGLLKPFTGKGKKHK